MSYLAADILVNNTRSKRWSLSVALVLFALAVLRWGPVHAQSPGTLFVLVKADSPLDKSTVEGRLDVPFFWIETDRIHQLTEELKNELPDLSNINEAEALARQSELTALAEQVIEPKKPAMKRAYRDAAAAGEISVRFGVTELPAIVEVSDDGYFRRIEGFTDVLGAIRELESLPYRHESDGLPRGAVDSGGFRKVSLANSQMPVVRRAPSPADPDVRAQETETETDVPITPDAACAAFDVSSLINFGDGILQLAEPGGGLCGTGPREEVSYSFVQAMVDASLPVSFDCLDLRVTGACAYVVTRFYCSPFGCTAEVSVEASIEVSHFNPDLLVGISKRLGVSPIQESEVLFGEVQNSLSEIIINALMSSLGAITGVPWSMPPAYSDTDQWAGVGSEGSQTDHKSTMLYHEVEAVGHPGTIFEFINDEGVDYPAFQRKLADIPTNIVDGATESFDQVSGGESSANLNDIYANADDIRDLPGYEDYPVPEGSGEPTDYSLVAIGERVFPEGIVAAIDSYLGISELISTASTAWEAVATLDIEDLMMVINEEVEELDVGDEQFSDAIGAFIDLEAIPDTIDGIEGLGAGNIDLWSFCPSDADVMKPYFMSGIDIAQWRFNIPEITYAQSYAFPLPGTDLYVGLGEGLTEEGAVRPEGDTLPISAVVQQFTSLFGAWGSVYPRQGYTTQSDEMKAAAVAGFRAAHVVTREDQKHIYNHLYPKRDPRYLKVDHPDPLSPIDETTGKWQLVAPELAEQCVVFGEEDGLVDPWTRDQQSDDRTYGYTLWREYVCCPWPKRNGATFYIVADLGTIEFEIDIL